MNERSNYERRLSIIKIKKFSKPIYVTSPFLPPFQEFSRLIEQIWENRYLTNNGLLHQQFEMEARKYLGVEKNTLFVNGHMALDIAIKSLRLTGEVITTPFTFASTTHAISMNGLIPVFCDVNKHDYNLDVSKIESLITEHTSAIIPVHVFGTPCDVYEIERIAKKYNLKVIYDAAHAFGVKVDGKGIGVFGDISMFSMHATKVFHSIEGGILTYHDETLSEALNQYKNFGYKSSGEVSLVGLNAKMNEFQAAMGILNLRHINEEINRRKKITSMYRNQLKSIPGIRFIEEMENVQYNYSYFSIEVDEAIYGLDRNQLYERLMSYNVFTRKYFSPLTSDFICYKDQYDSGKTPIAKEIANKVLVLPLYGELQVGDVEKICMIIKTIPELVELEWEKD
ncbi:DegT/DnrJ/EryC1/StrS family aminotransferase [Bacillus sp. UNC322MFChir4.1]|uniref:DegT/DnrJ/EryC1/StrS family aminotransferase n=1 Tax=Bacillus sp. UNC322MFChir4.1 TaxID=1449045 RepID=UPI00068E3CE2|nr:DegT/DnrJ/EryC1/StrS family aminotransferase [Bacillus sp. UNC322MFChir4.1]